MKSSLVSIYVLVFSLLKTDEILNKIDLRKATWWKFNDINLRKISTYKMKEFISNVGKKEEKSANNHSVITLSSRNNIPTHPPTPVKLPHKWWIHSEEITEKNVDTVYIFKASNLDIPSFISGLHPIISNTAQRWLTKPRRRYWKVKNQLLEQNTNLLMISTN